MKDLVLALGLLFFIEGLLVAMFPSRIKNMLKMIEEMPPINSGRLGFFFFFGFFNCVVYKKIMLLKFKNYFFSVILILLISNPSVLARDIPGSFADLAEKLMPSVVNISTTQTVRANSNVFPFQFPPGSPFEDMFKEFQRPTERKASSLGSGFIINKNGTVITNNHVIANAEDIVVKVNGKDYKAKVLGSDPLADIAVIKINSKDSFTPVKFGDLTKLELATG